MTSYISKRYHNRCKLGLIDDVLQWIYAIYGYFAGGTVSGYAYYYATTDRITFSSGTTVANTVSNLSIGRYGLAGLSDKVIYGYFGGGYSGSGGWSAITDRINFSSGITSANTISNLSSTRNDLAAISDGTLYGYFGGGNSSNAVIAIADRIVFSNGVTSANTNSNLSQARDRLASLSDGFAYGYFAGGFNGAYFTTADRIAFSSGTTTANSVSNLSVAKIALAGMSDNINYGYFSGGYSGAVSVTVDRIVFSSGVTAANTVSNLSLARWGLASNCDGFMYGYFSGGHTDTGFGGTILTDRIVFSTGVISANTISNLSQTRDMLSGLSDYAI